MSSVEQIEHVTSSAVRALCNSLAPSCVGCPSAQLFSSVDDDLSTGDIRVKLNVRCDKMGMSGPACPDGGTPGQTYLKDVGVTRTLGETQLSKAFAVVRGVDVVSADAKRMLKSPAYIDGIHSLVREQELELAKDLHIVNETIDFVTHAEPLDTPIIWVGDTAFTTYSEARSTYVLQHDHQYYTHRDHRSGICEPTPYMKDHFPKAHQAPFGIFTDPPDSAKEKRPRQAVRDEDGDVQFLGNDHPTKPETYIPPPTQEELYEDWGNFA